MRSWWVAEPRDDKCQSATCDRKMLGNPDVPAYFLAPNNRDMTPSCLYGQCVPAKATTVKTSDRRNPATISLLKGTSMFGIVFIRTAMQCKMQSQWIQKRPPFEGSPVFDSGHHFEDSSLSNSLHFTSQSLKRLPR